MRAYRNTSVNRFPNMFIINGPNLGSGHTSMIYNMFSADVPILERATHETGTHLDVLKGAGMQHIYILMPVIPEGGHAREHIVKWIRTSIRLHEQQS